MPRSRLPGARRARRSSEAAAGSPRITSRPLRARSRTRRSDIGGSLRGPRPERSPAAVESWRDEQGRTIYPLPFPDLAVEPGVFVPTQGSYLLWKHLHSTGLGAGGSCLDVGCGCGILAVQLALNGATSVHAIDIDRGSVANTLANAFRNGVSDRSAATRSISSSGSRVSAST